MFDNSVRKTTPRTTGYRDYTNINNQAKNITLEIIDKNT